MIARTTLGRLFALCAFLALALGPSGTASTPLDRDLDHGLLGVPDVARVARSPASHAPDAEPAIRGDDAYDVRFVCPMLEAGDVPAPDLERGRCPEDVGDEGDVMTSPILLVDPINPNFRAFNALHGGHGIQALGDGAPSETSRDNNLHQPHSTWYTQDTRLWNDNPYYSPLAPPPSHQNVEDPPVAAPTGVQVAGRQVFGEDNAATLDAQGRAYLASLYAYRETAGQGAYQYAFGLWKSHRVNQPVDYYSGNIVYKFPTGVNVSDPFAVYVGGADRVGVFWLEQNATSPLKSYINGLWTVPGRGALWTPIPERARIGPCDALTNPIAYQSILYIGCFPGEGYTQNPRATPGQLQIHSFDARQDRWNSTWVDETTIGRGISKPNAVLFDRTSGRMGVASAGIETNGGVFIKVAYGRLGAEWDPADNYANAVVNAIVRPPGVTMVSEARINAAAFILRSGNVHMIYQERYDFGDGQSPPAASAEFFKGFLSVHSGAEHTFNQLKPLGTDDANPQSVQTTPPADRASPCQLFDARYVSQAGVYKDLHDSIVVWNGRKGEQREFVAFGDCGNIRVAEVVEDEAILFGFPAPPGTPPIPSPLAGANTAIVGAVAGTIAGAMVLRMLAFKKKVAVEAPA